MQKKVLIMSASTGGGHNRAARAIKEELTNKSVNGITIDCEIIDSLKIVNGTMDKLISRGYEKSAKYTPKAWGGVYKLTETNLISRNEFKDNPLTSLVSRKLKKLIEIKKPDLIIGTHPFPMIALSTLKRNSISYANNESNTFTESLHKYYENLNIPPLVTVLTDYTTHSAYIQNEIDYYIAGHEYVKELLIEDGIDSDKIKPYGIPVEKSFLSHRDRAVVLSELNLDPNKFTVLLMGGSFGAGSIKDTLSELISIDRDFQIIVVAGRNKSLKDKLDKTIALNQDNIDKKICVLGFTDKMNDLLASVDILVSKPGGLTTTESLLKEVPMIVPYFIPGQEEENLDFLSNCGASLRTSKKYTLGIILKVLIDNPDRIDMAKQNIRSIKKLNASQDIAKLAFDVLSDEK
ncbi:MAG: glycosyltransferase [Clostridiales bacterium]|uniref:MGDG synthase family glycosyltransferase n=1 Tax=Terrisporobacter sp. TaxID=1965305 RepID=UPI002A5873B4|nr:glycosyltransferase [Terrisporobacter sp.]MCI6457971.1 glycosyl transferase [Clostridium sp.]MDD7753492.1 glycosyltransferase [Clostridiales bacterium]MCI7205665.1 glycosyl transferase [Clostridium sp.]MDY4133849.1 glycosyltransferase [Terrisporobacter sp.]MDY4735211.1 glycosyltransferase [Terrisporobacter sp.]